MKKVTNLSDFREAAKSVTSESLEETVKHLEEAIAGLDEKLSELSEKLGQKGLGAFTMPDFEEWTNRLAKVFTVLLRMADVREILQAEHVDEFGLDIAFEEKISKFFATLYEKYWRVEAKGLENVPSEGRLMIVGNHSGTLPYDAMMVKQAVRREHTVGRDIRFLVEDFVYHFPFLGTLMYRIGGVRACPENAIRLLERDHAVLVFPEGVKGLGKLYSERYRLSRFGRGGFIKICMRTGAPIVPVAIVGAEEIHPVIFRMEWFARAIGVPYIPITPTFPLLGPLGIIPLPTKWKIQFGEPIPFDHYTPAQIDNPILVNKLSEQVRQRVQGMVAEMLRDRTSIW